MRLPRETTPDWMDRVAVDRAWNWKPVGRPLTTAELVALAERALRAPEGEGKRSRFTELAGGVSASRAAEVMRLAAKRLGMTKQGGRYAA